MDNRSTWPSRDRASCLIVLLAGLFQPAAASAAGSALETALAVSERAARETAFDGVLEAINQSTVAAQISARVEEIPFDVGDYVEKGSVIIRFRDAEQRAQMESAQALLGEARARLADVEVNYERTKNIYARKLVAKAVLDTSAADLKSARARVEAALAGVDEVKVRLDNAVIRAPYSGIVVKRHIEVGETAVVGQALMTGLSLEHLRAVVEIPLQHIGPLRVHRKARVILPDHRSINASALRIPPNADTETHTFRVLVTLPEGEYGVFPGTLVKVAFISGEKDQLLVPAGAVVQRSEVTAVYVVGNDGRVSFRYVRTGTPTADDRVPILAGLTGGENIALDPIAAGIEYKKQAQAANVP